MSAVFLIGTVVFAFMFYAESDPASRSTRQYIAFIAFCLFMGALSMGFLMAVAAGGHLDAYTDTHM